METEEGKELAQGQTSSIGQNQDFNSQVQDKGKEAWKYGSAEDQNFKGKRQLFKEKF